MKVVVNDDNYDGRGDEDNIVFIVVKENRDEENTTTSILIWGEDEIDNALKAIRIVEMKGVSMEVANEIKEGKIEVGVNENLE